MADVYVEIPEASSEAKAPINQTLMRGSTSGANTTGGMRGNFKSHETRLLALEGGGGGGGGSGIAAEERFCEMEKRLSAPRVFCPTEGMCEAFIQPQRLTQARLLKAYTASDAKIHYAVNPAFLESGNEDSIFTGFVYVNFSNAGTIAADNTNHAIGSEGIGWNKTGGGVLSMVQRDITAAAAISVIGNQTLRMVFYLPVVSTVASLNVRIADDGETTVTTNYAQFDVTTQSDGSAFVIGKNTVEFDLSVASGTGGTSWDVSKLIRVFAPGVTTNSAGDLLTGVVADSIMFEENDNQVGLVKNPERLIQKTIELDLLDATNDDQFIIATGSPDVSGIVTPAAVVTTTYAGGSVSRIYRSTFKTDNGFAEFHDDALIASGSTANKNVFRNRTALPGGSSSNQTVALSVTRRHELMFEMINGTLTGTTLSISDPADQSANLPSGTRIRRYKKVWAEGIARLQENGQLILTAATTHSAGISTCTVASTTGIGDEEIVAREGVAANEDLEAFLGVQAATANVSYGAKKTPVERLARFQPIYPAPDKVIAHWRLGGPNTFAGTKQISAIGTLPDLTINGSLNQGKEFVDRTIQGASGYSGTNRFQLAASETGVDPHFGTAGGDALVYSIWVKRTASISGTEYLFWRHNGAVNGFYIAVNASNQVVVVSGSGLHTNTSATLALDTWTHVMVSIKDPTVGATDTDVTIWTGGVRADFNNVVDPGALSAILMVGSNGSSFWHGELADPVIWKGFDAVDTDIALIRNGGFWVDLANGIVLTERYEVTGQTGEILDSKIVGRRPASALVPTYSQFVTAKVN